MLIKIETESSKIIAVKAEGKVTRDDYERVLVPMLEAAHVKGQKIRFLYQFGAEFSGLSPAAAWDDFRVGLKYLSLFEKCAVVSDIHLIRNATKIASAFFPCPVKVFKNGEFPSAMEWLEKSGEGSKLAFELKDDGVLIVSPEGPLDKEDFIRMAEVVDPWIEKHQVLRGVVIAVHHFPGWENVGSMIQHFQFVKAHHRKVRRVALAVDGRLPEVASRLASHFIEAEIKEFPFAQKEKAIEWVSS
jgi:hypothetical protein